MMPSSHNGFFRFRLTFNLNEIPSNHDVRARHTLAAPQHTARSVAAQPAESEVNRSLTGSQQSLRLTRALNYDGKIRHVLTGNLNDGTFRHTIDVVN